MTKRTSLPVYLDDYEKQVLHSIASDEGISMSAVIQRFIRNHPNARKAQFLALKTDPNTLPKQSVSDLSKAPSLQGIYFLFDNNKNLVYIGQSHEIKDRFRTHNKISSNNISYYAYILVEDDQERLLIEADFIGRYNPALNEHHPSGHVWASDLSDRDMYSELD